MKSTLDENRVDCAAPFAPLFFAAVLLTKKATILLLTYFMITTDLSERAESNKRTRKKSQNKIKQNKTKQNKEMTTVYGGSVPPGLTAPTRGELKIRIERMQLHQERLVEIPQLRPFLKSRRDTAPSDGQAVGDNDSSGVTNDPMELKNLLNTLEDMFAIAPLFWGEERHLAECKEPLTDRTVGIRPASTTIICPVKTLQGQFSQYLSHSAMSPLKGLPLHLLIPQAKSGKKTPIIVGAATLNIVAISPTTPISGWFSIIGTSDRGELIAIGRVKVHVSVNFYLSGSSGGGGGGGGTSTTAGGAKVPSAGASTSTSEPGATLSGSAASSTADTAHLAGNTTHTVGGAQPVASGTANLSSSSLSDNDWAESASGAADRQGQGQSGGPDVGRPPLHRHTPSSPHPLTSASEKSLRRQQQKILQQQQKLLLQQQQQHHQRLLVEESILAANKGRPSLLDPSSPHPSSSFAYGLAEGSGALAAAGGLTAEQRRIIGEIALKGQRLKDELTLAAGRTEPSAAAGSLIGLDSGGSSEGLGDLYRKHAPALLASAMGAAKGFTAMGVLGADGPTGVEHRFLGGSRGARGGGFVLPPRDREDSLDSDLSHNDSYDEDDDVEYKDQRDHQRIRRNGNPRSPSRGSSSSSRSRGREQQNSSSSLSSLSSSRSSSSPHTHNRRGEGKTQKNRGESRSRRRTQRGEFSSHLSEVYLTLSDFSFTEVVEEIRVQLRLSKDVSCPSPFDALSSFVYYLPPPTAATVSQRQIKGEEEERSQRNPSIISIPLHFTVSSFTSESKLAVECYAVRSREVVINDGSHTTKRGGVTQRVVESERLLGVVFVGLYTAAPRLVLFHDPLSGKNPVEAVAEVRVMKGSEHSPRSSSSSPRHNMRARDENKDNQSTHQHYDYIGSEKNRYHDEHQTASRRESDNNHIGFDSASFGKKGELTNRKKRGGGHSSKEEPSSKRSANHRSSSSSSASTSSRGEENARANDRSKVVVYAAKGSSSTTTTATVTITNNSARSNTNGQLANNSPLTRGAADHDDDRMVITRIDPQCPHHGLVATAEKERALAIAKKEHEAELKRKAEREKEEAAEREADERGGTRLHISLKQAKEIPNVQVVANPEHSNGERMDPSSHLLGASGIILVDPTYSSPSSSSSASDGSPARPPHAFLVIEDFVYCDPPKTASHGDQGGVDLPPSASAAALISSLSAVRLPLASAASTSFRDFIVRLEEKLSIEQEKEGGRREATSSPSSLSAEWSMDELSVVRGDFDRTLVSEASNKPQWNYESSVFIKGRQRGGTSNTATTQPLVSGLIVSLWHYEPSALAAEEEKAKSKKHKTEKNENNTDEEERRFWSRSSRIGTSFVDLRGLRYLSTVEGWYRCYSDHHCVDTTVGYLQLSVRKL